ncbi:16S rRNA (cytosine(967)-C(5))-methyltransferase [Oscillatoria sp. CS-180]|uniref:16S rRNA (cytosine(967)-C(5))-methyltransferase n=1 Tax=Oscillatoria sp. CS-180 TaxID=3021720 RepID=UPI00232C2040|nr:16S rRNA (cytosine(967)-C(5))-methyltransferase [Oscillatoria sp. CS-180]MDB9526856.1 16S rRNA (cytosine(967)-C(5))-methyltransferase [Oscillatoria sp. CS-180]
MSVQSQPASNAASPARRLAFEALKEVHQGGFADVVLHRLLHRHDLNSLDRQFATELVYGTVRRQRTLDALIDQLGKKSAQHQPLDLRIVLHLGLYQLRFLTQVPESAAVNTSVELMKAAGKTKLSGVVNGILRQYIRLQQASVDPLQLPDDRTQALAIAHSYPDWIVKLWQTQLNESGVEALCKWFNQAPSIDLRVNRLKISVEELAQKFSHAGIETIRLPQLPQALRLVRHVGAIRNLPGYAEGLWTIQDASAQLVSHFVSPQPGDVVIDACAAPGGKTTHLAELMGDQGLIWACDRTTSRLNKVKQNIKRLELSSIKTFTGDSTVITRFEQQGDRVIVDAPCSGLGTLHRHADARWRQTPETVAELATLQTRLLAQVATWVKSNGTLIYSTCTLHPSENEAVVQQFLQSHPEWRIVPPAVDELAAAYTTPAGTVKVWPHQHDMDGFFMARLRR